MKKKTLLILCLTCLALLCACGKGTTNTNTDNGDDTNRPSEGEKQTFTLPEIVDAPLLNQQRAALTLPSIDVKDMYIVVASGDTEATSHTFDEINTYSADDYEKMGVDKYQVVGWLLEDKASAVSGNPNFTLSIRGQSSTKASQKSYKLKLDGITWMDQKTINLNKHYSDRTRILNKLAYDLMDEVPQLLSLQTQFVHLYIKDLSGDKNADEAEFEDYGLFTHVEQLNKTAMKRLGLDKNGSLYKISNYEFFEYDEIKLTTDPEYSEAAFEARLENKGDTDNEKLLEFAHIVNSSEITDEELLDCYLDLDNVAYWMAFQMLIDNVDTNCRNFYIYSPADLEKWYFISWDNDGAFAHLKYEYSNAVAVPWRTGVADYWGTVLFKRLLRTEKFRKAVLAAAQDLKTNYLTSAHIADLIDLYYENVEDIMFNSIDKTHLSRDQKEWLTERYPDEIEVSYQRIVDSMKSPMPFFFGTIRVESNVVSLNWGESYDFNGEKITYLLEVSDDPSFENILYSAETREINTSFSHKWGKGTFYIRLTAVNESGYRMASFDSTSVKGYGTVYSTKSYTVQ